MERRLSFEKEKKTSKHMRLNDIKKVASGDGAMTQIGHVLDMTASADMLDSADLLAFVEQELERREAMVEIKTTKALDTTVKALGKIILRVLTPVMLIALAVMLYFIASDTPGEDALTLSFWGRVVGSTLSYLGCIYIIASHFLHPELWSQRRQQMMLSSWPGLIHYFCILYEAHEQGQCNHVVTAINHTAFMMQMAWQVAVAHGIFKYIELGRVIDRAIDKTVIARHILCWGLPLASTALLLLIPTPVDVFENERQSAIKKAVVSPWCGVSGDPSIRAVKALCVHAPQVICVVIYGYYYYHIASQKYETKLPEGLNNARISTSPHQDLFDASEKKRLLDITRAVATLRHCMTAFMCAYLAQTLICMYAEQFDLRSTSANILHVLRVFMVTFQQFLYALVFARVKTNVMGQLLQMHTATISSAGGATLAEVNTTVNRFILKAVVDRSAVSAQDVSSESGEVEATTEADSEEPQKISKIRSLKELASMDKNLISMTSFDSVRESRRYRLFKQTARLGRKKRGIQTVFFIPVSLFSWVPLQFMQNNYTKRLRNMMIGSLFYTSLAMFPFFYFQGTRDNDSQRNLSVVTIDSFILVLLFLCVLGVYKNRRIPELVVVDNPRSNVRCSPRNFLGYGTLVVEFWQLPMLAISATRLVARYRPSEDTAVMGSDTAELSWQEVAIAWLLDNLFLIQYPLAVAAVAIWALLFATAQAAAIVYRRPVDEFLEYGQLIVYVLSGPGYLFIVKNLMKGLFCIPCDPDTMTCVPCDPVTMACDENGNPLVLSAQQELICWDERHLTYCTFSLFALCLFLPSATLTSAVKYSEGEDIRYVYLFLRIELLLKGMMTFFALANQKNPIVALSSLILGSIAIVNVVSLMHPSNLPHINRLKYFVHACSSWMCLTCIWAVHPNVDNKDWKLHALVVMSGWLVCGAVLIACEIYASKTDIFKKEATKEIVGKCTNEITELHRHIVKGDIKCGRTFNWVTHSYILKLIKYAEHPHVQVSRKSFDSLAALSYLDQMTTKDAFFAYTPTTSAATICKAIGHNTDDSVQNFAIRTLKTFMQEERCVAEVTELINDDEKVVRQIVNTIQSHTAVESTKLDAAICLLAVCTMDSNQLKSVVELLPTLNEWITTGSLVMQHLSLEIIARMSCRFDIVSHIIVRKSVEKAFELFSAVEQASSNDADLEDNLENGFRIGCRQPGNFSSLAHQLPKNVIHDFSAQFSTVPNFLRALSGEGSAEEVEVSVALDEFISWMNSGNPMSMRIKEKLIGGEIKGLDVVGTTPEARTSALQYEQLFVFMDDDGSGDLDEEEIAAFLEVEGLGKKEEISQILLDTGLRQRGIAEMRANADADKIGPEQFRAFCRDGLAKTGSLAHKIVLTCIDPKATEVLLTDAKIDELFREIDDDGGGTLDAAELAEFLAKSGLGGMADIEEMLSEQMVGKSVTDTVVQLSVKHTDIMKTEMIQFVLHILMECAAGVSGLGRQKLVEEGAWTVIRRSLSTRYVTSLRVTALQALHALSSDRFSLEDVMADEEFEGYYGDCMQLAEEALENPDLCPVLTFKELNPLQRRKVHVVAEFAKLRHQSSGPIHDRTVTVGIKSADTDSIQFSNPISSQDYEPDSKLTDPLSMDGVDPYAQIYYDETRHTLAQAGVLRVLCNLLTLEPDLRPELAFYALDVIVLFVDRNVVPKNDQPLVFVTCRRCLSHENIGVAVLAAYPLAAVVGRKASLFAKKRGKDLFIKAAHLVMIIFIASRGVKHHELDIAVQESRNALR